MRRPQRRLHLLMWTAIAPAVAFGVFFALTNIPPETVVDLDDRIVESGTE